MRWWAAAMVVMLAGGAEARAKSTKGRIRDRERYDASLDFSKHFDDEVRREGAVSASPGRASYRGVRARPARPR